MSTGLFGEIVVCVVLIKICIYSLINIIQLIKFKSIRAIYCILRSQYLSKNYSKVTLLPIHYLLFLTVAFIVYVIFVNYQNKAGNKKAIFQIPDKPIIRSKTHQRYNYLSVYNFKTDPKTLSTKN